MARKDDYENAFKIAAEELTGKKPQEVADRANVGFDDQNNCFEFDFIGRPISLSWPEVKLRYRDSEEDIPLTEQVMVLHYLNRADGTPLAGELITYREIPSGEFYFSAFQKRAEAPMLSVFGPNPELLARAAPKIGGRSLDNHGDEAARFSPLPQVPLTLVIWGGDEEFEPSGKILFDRSVDHYLSTEDAAWLSGMVVYRLMRLAHS